MNLCHNDSYEVIFYLENRRCTAQEGRSLTSSLRWLQTRILDIYENSSDHFILFDHAHTSGSI